jgi:hypothetical protein
MQRAHFSRPFFPRACRHAAAVIFPFVRVHAEVVAVNFFTASKIFIRAIFFIRWPPNLVVLL